MSKKWTRRSALALIGSGAGLLTWGTGGFTDVTAERQVNIDKAEDSSDGPLLGVSGKSSIGGPGETVSLIELKNNDLGAQISSGDIDADIIEITDSSGNLVQKENVFKDNNGFINLPETIDVGDTESIEATLQLRESPNDGSYDVTLDIAATAGNQEVILSRTVEVTYDDPRVSWWNFEEVDGETVPDEWGSNGATRPRYEDIGYEPAEAGNVLYYDGSRDDDGFGDDVIELSDSSKLDFTKGDDFSFSVWIRPYSIPNLYSRLFSKWDSPSNNRDSDAEKGYQFFLGETDYRLDNKFEIGIETGQKDGKTNVIKTGATVGEGNWNHVVWTHRSSKPSEDRVYINGDYENNGYSGDLKDPFGSDEPLRIGNGIDGNDDLSFPFDGFMDEPKAYDAALTSEQVQNLYETSKNGDAGSIGG